jgi:hypothetical protein
MIAVLLQIIRSTIGFILYYILYYVFLVKVFYFSQKSFSLKYLFQIISRHSQFKFTVS